MTLSDLKALQASKAWKHFYFLSENQSGYACAEPLKGAVKKQPKPSESRPEEGGLRSLKGKEGKKSTAKQAGLKTGENVENFLKFSGSKLLSEGLEMEFVEVKTAGNESSLQKQTV